MIISISLSHCAFGIFATIKHIRQRDKCGLEIPTDVQSPHFHGTEKAIKLAKKIKVANIEENLNGNVKRCPK